MGFRSTLADVIDLETRKRLMPKARRAGPGRFAPIVRVAGTRRADWSAFGEQRAGAEPEGRPVSERAQRAVCEPPPGGGGAKHARGRKRLGDVEVIYRKGRP